MVTAWIARPWVCHAPTTIGREVDGHFEAIAECSGLGRHSSEAEAFARQIAAQRALAIRVAQLNAAAGEIGAGMLAQLVAEARFALGLEDA